MSRTALRLAAIPLITGLGLAASVFAQEPDGQGGRPSASVAAQSERKIDPDLRTDLELLEGEAQPEGLRVVIELEVPTNATRFANAQTADPVNEVATAVLDRQLEFLDDLNREPDLVAQGSVEVLDFLTLQYSVVARIGSRSALQRLAQRSDVKFIRKDHLNVPFTVQGRVLTGSDTAAANGHDGGGVGVAVIDSHFDLLHPELGASTSLPNSVVSAGQNFSDPGTSIHSRNFNDCYHGTGTASIVKRYAPGVDLYLATVFPNAYDSVIANAINWAITNKNGAGGGAPIRVISMSLGGGRYYSACNSGTMHTAAGDAVANGILVFAASGNDGWQDSMGSPACSSNVISVGSVWDQNGAPYSPFPPANCSDTSRSVNERTCYSDTASFLDVYAPSEEVICAQCGGGTFALGGTSSACPAAAALTAQLLDANPALIGNKSGVVSLYQSTGVTVIGDSSKRRIDLTAAIGGGGGGGGPVALSDGVPVNFTVATGATKAFTIAIPANAINLNVAITGSGDADLYVKRTAISWPGDQGAHNEAEFKAPYIGGSAESVDFAAPAAATWNVLVHGYSGNPACTITANWDISGGGGGPVALADGVATNYSVATGATTAFTIAVPANATSLAVTLTGSGDADLYVKRTTINWPADQGAHNEAEFKAPYIGGSAESVTFTNPAAATWNVLVHGYSGNPTGTITANWEVSSGPSWHYVSYVQQTPHNYANNSTYTFTYEFPGATQTGVHFTTLNTEANYDFLRIYNASNTLMYTVSGNLISSGTGSAFGRTDGWVIIPGSKVRVELVTDYSVTRYGYLTNQAGAFY